MKKSNYYDHPALSQSYLKGLVSKGYDSKSLLGSVVDVLATEEESFADNFVVGPRITPSLAELFNKTYEEHGTIDVDKVLITNIKVQHGKGKYTRNYFEEKIDENWDYISLLGDKTIIDQELLDTATRMVNAVYDGFPELLDYEKQVELYGTINGYDAKCRIDYLKDEVVDLKTIYDINEIESNFWKYRYDFQMAWYTTLAKRKKARLIFVSPEGYVKELKVHPDTLRQGRYGGHRKVEERTSGYTRYKYVFGFEDILKNLSFLEKYRGYKNYDFIFNDLEL